MDANRQSTLSVARQRAGEWTRKVWRGMVRTPSASEPEPEEAPTTAPGSALYQHTTHPHQPRNVNRMHQREKAAGGFNTRVAVWLTKNVGTMQCAYLFAGIGIGSLVGVLTQNVLLAAVFGSVSSYFLQLVLLPILSVGQNVLGRHQELQAEETYKRSQRAVHDLTEIMAHLAAQDEEMLKQTKLLMQLIGQPAASAPATPPTPPTSPATPPTKARKGKQQ